MLSLPIKVFSMKTQWKKHKEAAILGLMLLSTYFAKDLWEAFLSWFSQRDGHLDPEYVLPDDGILNWLFELPFLSHQSPGIYLFYGVHLSRNRNRIRSSHRKRRFLRSQCQLAHTAGYSKALPVRLIKSHIAGNVVFNMHIFVFLAFIENMDPWETNI